MGNKKQFEHLRNKVKEENRLKYIMANYAINWKDGTTTHLNQKTNKIETIKTKLL
jgi:hypothetical protein